MHDYSLTHLVDAVLLRELASKVAQERTGLAEMLALIGEVDARRLYAPVGHSSMHAFLVKELRFSDDAAFKRIQAARAARRFPVLYAAMADGRLHLTGICLLAPHLNHEKRMGVDGSGQASSAAGDRGDAGSARGRRTPH